MIFKLTLLLFIGFNMVHAVPFPAPPLLEKIFGFLTTTTTTSSPNLLEKLGLSLKDRKDKLDGLPPGAKMILRTGKLMSTAVKGGNDAISHSIQAGKALSDTGVELIKQVGNLALGG